MLFNIIYVASPEIHLLLALHIRVVSRLDYLYQAGIEHGIFALNFGILQQS